MVSIAFPAINMPGSVFFLNIIFYIYRVISSNLSFCVKECASTLCGYWFVAGIAVGMKY